MFTLTTERESVATPVKRQILESLYDDIKDAYPDFDKNYYRLTNIFRCSLDRPSSYAGQSNTEWTLDVWIREASQFLYTLLLQTFGVPADASEMLSIGDASLFLDTFVMHTTGVLAETSEILAKGFVNTVVERFSLESRFAHLARICCRVLSDTHSNNSVFLASQNALFKSASNAVNTLSSAIRILDYARIADRHLQINKLHDDIQRGECHAAAAVESTQKILDSNALELTTGQREGLERVLYNAAKQQGLVPSSFYVKNVRRLGDDYFGGGGYGDVYKGKIRDKLVAIKVSRVFGRVQEAERLRRELCKEALIWQRLSHPNVLPFLGLCKEGFRSIGIVSPFMQNGDVLTYVRTNPLADKKKLIWEIAQGLQYIHHSEPKVIHGDLKCANVLVDDGGNARIADFGLARLTGIAASSTTFEGRGSLRWQAPELIHPKLNGGDGLPNEKTDIYAFGMTCLEARSSLYKYLV